MLVYVWVLCACVCLFLFLAGASVFLTTLLVFFVDVSLDNGFDCQYISVVDCLERLVSEMSYYVSSGTLSTANSFTDKTQLSLAKPFTPSALSLVSLALCMSVCLSVCL